MSSISFSDSRLKLRSPDSVMRLERLGSAFPTRLSFGRSMIRNLIADDVDVRRTRWTMNDQGYGRATYTLDLGGHTYSLIAFSNALNDADRSDRVIAEAWDASFALFDGIPEDSDLDRLESQLAQAGSRAVLREGTGHQPVQQVRPPVQSRRQRTGPRASSLTSIWWTPLATSCARLRFTATASLASRIASSSQADRPGLRRSLSRRRCSPFGSSGTSRTIWSSTWPCALGGDTAVPLRQCTIKRHLGHWQLDRLWGWRPSSSITPNSSTTGSARARRRLPRVRAVESLSDDTADRGYCRCCWSAPKAHVSQWFVPDEIQTARLDVLQR